MCNDASPCRTRSFAASAQKKLGRSLSIREAGAGTCNGSELEIQAFNHPFYDVEHICMRFVASPRRADVSLVTGPATRDMPKVLERTDDAAPAPKWVVAVGDCAIYGGCFAGSCAIAGGVSEIVPVDLHIPGRPPSPTVLLKGLLAVMATAKR